MLYREPKLLKRKGSVIVTDKNLVSVLYREPKLLKPLDIFRRLDIPPNVSVLYREPKLLKPDSRIPIEQILAVSVLYREPKLLKH
mgnify:CR=1 FL=1